MKKWKELLWFLIPFVLLPVASSFGFLHEQMDSVPQFIIVENSKLEELKKNVTVGFWEKYDDSHTVVRLATSWATTDADIEELAKYL